jgi:hypothetical protein
MEKELANERSLLDVYRLRCLYENIQPDVDSFLRAERMCVEMVRLAMEISTNEQSPDGSVFPVVSQQIDNIFHYFVKVVPPEVHRAVVTSRQMLLLGYDVVCDGEFTGEN